MLWLKARTCSCHQATTTLANTVHSAFEQAYHDVNLSQLFFSLYSLRGFAKNHNIFLRLRIHPLASLAK
jgi:hypothetical protein